MKERSYIAIDLKSFYASVECVERGLDPLKTNLVVADPTRTEKTICLAVSPSLKAYGIPGRARLFEVVQKVQLINAERRRLAPGKNFSGKTIYAEKLLSSPELALDYLVAPPQMARYMKVSAQIYQIYLRYIAPEDIHVYSIDEVFIDATNYLGTYRMTARELTMRMILDVLHQTGITATAGIGTNLYLAKIAMDIGAKRIQPDENGVRICELDELRYRQMLWSHRPLTDFWRVGRGYAKRLEAKGLYTMGDIARCSIGKADEFYNEDLLYQMFGVHAELLIDHAWGWEPCTIQDIKAYKPESKSISTGQVLQCAYDFEKAKVVIREMADALALDLLERRFVTDQIVLTVGYDVANCMDTEPTDGTQETLTTDFYGRKIPKEAHGSENLGRYTSSAREILTATTTLFERIVNPKLLVRRMYVVANHIREEMDAAEDEKFEQLNLFTDYAAENSKKEEEKEKFARERRKQEAVLQIKKKYGKNAILTGMNFQEGATARERNGQIGGHKA